MAECERFVPCACTSRSKGPTGRSCLQDFSTSCFACQQWSEANESLTVMQAPRGRSRRRWPVAFVHAVVPIASAPPRPRMAPLTRLALKYGYTTVDTGKCSQATQAPLRLDLVLPSRSFSGHVYVDQMLHHNDDTRSTVFLARLVNHDQRTSEERIMKVVRRSWLRFSLVKVHTQSTLQSHARGDRTNILGRRWRTSDSCMQVCTSKGSFPGTSAAWRTSA